MNNISELQYLGGELSNLSQVIKNNPTEPMYRLLEKTIIKINKCFKYINEHDFKFCVICGKRFLPKTGLELYCSDECKEIAVNQNKAKFEKKMEEKLVMEYDLNLDSSYVPKRCRALGQTSCFTCDLPKCLEEE